MRQNNGAIIGENKSPFVVPSSITSKWRWTSLLWIGLNLFSAVGILLTVFAWYRSEPGSTTSDELEFVCFYGCAAHSINERLYISVFREPEWWSVGYPLRIRSDHGFSAGFFSVMIMREFGDDTGVFGATYATLEDEDPPASRRNVVVVMIPYWFAVLVCLQCPSANLLMRMFRHRTCNSNTLSGVRKS